MGLTASCCFDNGSSCSADESYFRSMLLYMKVELKRFICLMRANPDPLSWRQFAIPADVWNELSPLNKKFRQQHELDYQPFDETPDAMMQVLEGLITRRNSRSIISILGFDPSHSKLIRCGQWLNFTTLWYNVVPDNDGTIGCSVIHRLLVELIRRY